MKQRCLCIILALLSLLPCHSQDLKRVSGRILDKTTGKPIDLQQVVVNIYAFNTVAAAQDVKKQMDGDENSIVIPDAEAHPDDNGYYEIPVAETGALIFKAEMKEALLEPVNFRMEINVRIEMDLTSPGTWEGSNMTFMLGLRIPVSTRPTGTVPIPVMV